MIFRVAGGKVLDLNLTRLNLSCPELTLNLRDGVLGEDPLLVQARLPLQPLLPLHVISSLNPVRLELNTVHQRDLLSCFMDIQIQAAIIG